MNTIKVRNLILGEGMPKICVPIVGITKKEILSEAKLFNKYPIDMVEWRADWFEDVFNTEKVIDILFELRNIFQETPILFTFRSKNEGGEKFISLTDYANLNIAVARSDFVDLIDLEIFNGYDFIVSLISTIHNNDVKIIGSYHDFEKTPSQKEIISRLCKIQDLGIDIAKIAVMPTSYKDVLTLLEATLEMNEKYVKVPIITMSMSNLGTLSRLSGEYFGSAVTFAAIKKSSAPGQLEVEDLIKVLKIVHNNY